MERPTIVFFWRNQSNEIPDMLVRSIRLIYQGNCRVLQVSDPSTESVRGVDQCFRGNFSENIMLARLEGFSIVPISNTFTYFCDADSLLINQFLLEKEYRDHDVVLNTRTTDVILNHNFPEYYPEFVNRKASEMMPFLFGGIAIRRDQSFFKELLGICESLPPRFWRWYGDQVALNQLVTMNRGRFAFFKDQSYLTILKNAPSKNQLLEMREKGVKFITFKGPKSKAHMKPTYELLTEIC